MRRHIVPMRKPTPEHCRLCGWNKQAHGQRYTSDKYRDEVTNEYKLFPNSVHHFYIPITMEEFKQYLLRKRNDRASECDGN